MAVSEKQIISTPLGNIEIWANDQKSISISFTQVIIYRVSYHGSAFCKKEEDRDWYISRLTLERNPGKETSYSARHNFYEVISPIIAEWAKENKALLQDTQKKDLEQRAEVLKNSRKDLMRQINEIDQQLEELNQQMSDI